jgi:hypothetical protein
MRKVDGATNPTYWLLNDQVGSTAITADSTGVKTAELRFKVGRMRSKANASYYCVVISNGLPLGVLLYNVGPFLEAKAPIKDTFIIKNNCQVITCPTLHEHSLNPGLRYGYWALYRSQF